MSNQRPHIIELLRRWLRGDARARDEGRLERQGADDDFLRDALEGYRSFPESDHEAAAGRLRERLQQRTGKRGGGMVMMWLPRAAAAAVALMAIASVTWLFLQNDAPEELAFATEETEMVEAIEREDNPAGEPSIIQEPETTERLRRQEPQESTRPSSEPSEPTEVRPSPSRRELSAQENTRALAENEAGIEAAEEPSTGRIPAEPDLPAAYDAPVAMAREDTSIESEAPTSIPQAPVSALRTTRGLTTRPAPADSSTRLLEGQILTPDGEPLIGANVLIPGTSTGTVTNLEGRFSIEAPSGQESIMVSYVGYQTASIPIDQQDSFRITLAEDAPLSEVVITGLSRAKRKEAGIAKISEAPAAATGITGISSLAVPRGGFPELEKYIRKNLRYPEEAREADIEGFVLLRFTVQADGSLDNFEVLQSLCETCDQEAIRLLKEGPAWQVQTAEAPVMISYPVKFEL